ncbi:MAG TPA: 2-succinyl-5-enolpyruvyl-6-hydroxy-3-cyclohexene-1-carboxylic-acid synthase [Humibacter sp.]|nr:2-succinyl-5-enolpyruvyl-6-hydroxy-3-cyclohexene-1-carboxylic-acid synthase [Humibacter sp.]
MPEASGSPGVLTTSPATDRAIALLTAFVRLGVRHIVLSPGSRSQALALVAAELERVQAVELHVRIDERVAGFLAVGIAVERAAPALVITTSGTATANVHPAVLEAHHSGVPLIVLTADRPEELRCIRSNQTTHQPGMYGPAVRFSVDLPAPAGEPGESDAAAAVAEQAWSAALGTQTGTPGPVHLNLAFREPLSAAVPDLSDWSFPSAGRAAEPPSVVPGRSVLELDSPARTVVIAGHGAGPDAEEFARSAGWPLLAEVSSGSRFGPNLVVAYRELLAEPQFGGTVERAVVFGHPTLSREVPALLRRPEVEVIVVAPTGAEVYDPDRSARIVSAVRVDRNATDPSPESRAWLGSWVFTSRRLLEQRVVEGADQLVPDVDAGRSHDPADRLTFARAELAAVRAPISRTMLADALWRFTWPHDRLVLGASRLIRDLDRTVAGKRIPVHANRGLAGIDGTVSTAIGIALAAPAATGVTRVLLGDLTLLHDVGALLFGVGERRPTLQVVIGNDGGGTIFDGLEVAWSAPPEAMERVMLTPQKVDVGSLAAAYGWHFTRATTRGELDQALSAPPEGTSILEVPLPR